MQANKTWDIVTIISLTGTAFVVTVPVCLRILLSVRSRITDSVKDMNAVTASAVKSALAIICFAAAVGTRILYMFFRPLTVRDTYGYYADAMIQLGEKNQELTFGISYAYINQLSKLFLFTGNKIEAVVIYQLILQIAALILLVIAIKWFCGWTAAFVLGGILAFSDYYYNTAGQLTPSVLLFFYFSAALLLVSFYYFKTQKNGFAGYYMGVFLFIAGIVLGVISIWSYTGWVPVIILIVISIGNIWKIQGKEQCKGIHPFIQAFTGIAGILTGMAVTLLRYARVSEVQISTQINWWIKQYNADQSAYVKGLDYSQWILLVIAIAAGVGAKIILGCQGNVQSETEEIQNAWNTPEIIVREEDSMETEHKEMQETVSKIKLLDNPLPVPPKHVSKEMDFDIKDNTGEFDHPALNNDDFDI